MLSNEDQELKPSTLWSERNRAIECEIDSLSYGYVSNTSREEFTKRARVGQYRTLLNEMADAAQAYAELHKIAPDDFANGVLNEALETCTSIYRALQPKPRLEGPFYVWKHVPDIMYRVRRRDLPEMDRQELYDATDKYLRLPVRCEMVDRMLVDALIAAEAVAFAREMFQKDQPYAASPFKNHIFWRWLGTVIFDCLLFAFLLGIVLFLAHNEMLGAEWALWINVGLAGLFLLDIGQAVVRLPSAWRLQTKARVLVLETMNEMLLTYNELREKGPVSVQRVRDLAEHACSKSVSWPAPLFALLDDLRLRNARL